MSGPSPYSPTPPNEFPLSCSSTQAPRTRPQDPFPALGSPGFLLCITLGPLETVLLPRIPRTAFFQFSPSKRSETPRVPASATSSPYSGPIPARSLSPLAGPKYPRRPLSYQEPIRPHLQPAPGRDGGGRPSRPAELSLTPTRAPPTPLSTLGRVLRTPPEPEATLGNPPSGPLTPTSTSSRFWARPPLLQAGRARAFAPRGAPVPQESPQTAPDSRSRPVAAPSRPPRRPSRRPLLQDGGGGGGG